MNGLFHDSSIGHQLNFTILALVLLEGDEVSAVPTKSLRTGRRAIIHTVQYISACRCLLTLFICWFCLLQIGLVVNEKADETLHNFCHWQSNLQGLHHDHAILLTGVDICSFNGQYCDTLGEPQTQT